MKTLRYLVAISLLALLSGCAANQQQYKSAFNTQTALTQNQKAYDQSADALFKVAKQTFVQQGFTVESADQKSGIIKAIRNLQDKEDPEISYNIHASVDVSSIGEVDSTVALSASQQTILHRASTTWWHLLWILPVIPTGTEYQTLVIKEGNITEPEFYTDFFNSLTTSATKYGVAVKEAQAKAAAAAAKKAEEERVIAEEAARKAEVARLERERIAAAAKAEEARKLAILEAERNAAIEKAAAEAKASREKAEAEAKALKDAEAAKSVTLATPSTPAVIAN